MWDEGPERLKREWTGRRVRVRPGFPTLARFAGRTGVVRTVNMSGRPLVEFENTPDVTWYDLELAGLEVVGDDVQKAGALQRPGFEENIAPAVAAPDPRPMPDPVTHDSPTQARHPEKPLSVLDLARQQGAAKKP